MLNVKEGKTRQPSKTKSGVFDSIKSHAKRYSSDLIEQFARAANDAGGDLGNAIKSHLSGDRKPLAHKAKTDPKRTTAGLASVGISSKEGLDYIESLMIDTTWDQELTPVFKHAYEMANKMADITGVGDPTPETDGKIAGVNVASIDASVTLFRAAENSFHRAARVVGGRDRLLALMDWLTIDNDLQTLVIRHVTDE